MARRSSLYSEALSAEEPSNEDDWKIRLGFLLHDCARLRRQVMDEVFRPLSVTRSQAWLLAHLSRRDGITQTALAESMDLGKVAVGSLAYKLEANGMIERRADPQDRRVNNLFITGRGHKVVRRMRKLTADANVDMLEGMSQRDLRTVVALLGKLKRNLRSMQ